MNVISYHRTVVRIFNNLVPVTIKIVISKFFFPCVQVPDHLEPGLDDKQLTRLLGLDLQGAERTPDPPERPRKRAGLTDLSPDEVQLQLEKQKDSSKWHNLVEGNLILKQGLVDKRKVRSQFYLLTSLLLCGCSLYVEVQLQLISEFKVIFLMLIYLR